MPTTIGDVTPANNSLPAQIQVCTHAPGTIAVSNMLQNAPAAAARPVRLCRRRPVLLAVVLPPLLLQLLLLLVRRPAARRRRWLHGRWRRRRTGCGGWARSCRSAGRGSHEACLYRAQDICTQLLQPRVLLRLALVPP